MFSMDCRESSGTMYIHTADFLITTFFLVVKPCLSSQCILLIRFIQSLAQWKMDRNKNRVRLTRIDNK